MNTKSLKMLATISLASLAIITPSAYSATINITGINPAANGYWHDPVPISTLTNANIKYYNNSATALPSGSPNPNNEIRWGDPNVKTDKSGYKFVPVSTPINNVPVNTNFVLGDFTHFNQPINSNSSITGVQLSILVNLTINGSPQLFGFTYNFNHNETPNSGENCCADIVTIGANPASQNFIVDGLTYTLNILGFQKNGVFTNQFNSPENGDNTVKLVASISPPQVGGINAPEPGTYLILGSTLLAAAIMMKKRARVICG